MNDGNQTISRIGVLSGGLNIKSFNEILQSPNLSSQERIVLLDSNGTKIADSDTGQQSSLLKTLTKMRHLEISKVLIMQ
jgi:hypothetical protein